MEKLPPTSYVRMVDIWLICAQIIPFVEVILLTSMEHFNTPEAVNHHGRSKKLFLEDIEVNFCIISG